MTDRQDLNQDENSVAAWIAHMLAERGIEIDDDTLRAEAIEWQATRGARSGRVAWQFFMDLAGREGVSVHG